MSRTYKDRRDIRMDHPNGIQPSKVDTSTRIRWFGWQYEDVDTSYQLPDDLPLSAAMQLREAGEIVDLGTKESGPMVRRL